MKIIVDAYGGDNAPEAPVKASLRAAKEMDVDILLVGKEKELTEIIGGTLPSNVSIHNASEVITNEDKPATAIREKKDSTLVVGAKLLKDGAGDAFVSAGNTGALLASVLTGVGRIKGIRRPALATLLPAGDGRVLFLDSGANTGCHPEDLLNFAVMGSIYMKKVTGVKNPRVAILSNGQEEGKGDELVKQAYELLKESELNFIGNCEGRDIMSGMADVIVCDGFAGNIALKTIEGTAKTITKELKKVFFTNLLTKICAAGMKKYINAFKGKFDYKEYGGAPLLGIKKPVVKAHGSSDEKAFCKAIGQAVKWTKENVTEDISAYVDSRKTVNVE